MKFTKFVSTCFTKKDIKFMLLENSKKIKNMLTIRSILMKVKFPKASWVYPKALIIIRLNYGTMLVHNKK